MLLVLFLPLSLLLCPLPCLCPTWLGRFTAKEHSETRRALTSGTDARVNFHVRGLDGLVVFSRLMALIFASNFCSLSILPQYQGTGAHTEVFLTISHPFWPEFAFCVSLWCRVFGDLFYFCSSCWHLGTWGGSSRPGTGSWTVPCQH
jgi:hypothetical protein